MTARILVPALSVVVLSACSVDDRNVSAGEAFSDNLEYAVSNTPQVSPLPTGTSDGPQPVALAANSAPLQVAPRGALSFGIGWQGGPIASVNMSFTLNQYFSIPVPLAGSDTSGVVTIPAVVGAAVCDSLDDICHQIECFEQVVTADGVVSVAQARQLVLDCGGMGCGGPEETGMGIIPIGDPCEETMECVPGSVCFNKYCVGSGTLRVSLGFTVDSDFDLHVLTPSGAEVYFGNRTADGGTLDVDQCVGSCEVAEHAENIVFDGGALTGAYQVWVENYNGRSAGDFTIQVAGDVTANFSGTLTATAGEESTHFMFTL